MAWLLNFYKCDRCRRRWTDEWSCICDDTCPRCGARDMTPYESEELTTVIEEEGKEFVVLWSPETAEHTPNTANSVASHRAKKRWSFCRLTGDSKLAIYTAPA